MARPKSVLRSDAALAAKGGDRLGRSAFAERVAKDVLLPIRDFPLVVSLEGPWGTGKTSTFNLMKVHLAEGNAIIFDFNPWMTNSAEALTESFLIKLASAIGVADRAKEGKAAANQQLNY
jgi:predicted KAP-like P-loop ATPase